MKKAPPVRLSLRKLFIAMLAVGPISILPSPLLAAVPTGTPFTVLNGGTAVTWSGSGNLGTLSSTVDRAVVSWNPTSFTIQAGDTFNFSLPSNASVILNKVGYGTNGVTIGSTDNAVINGALVSNGRVIVLANGNISVGPGAQITTGGLILSTLLETDTFTFTSSGNLALTGAPANGGASSITVGALGNQTVVSGSLSAYSGNIALDNVNVLGDLIVNQKSTSLGLSLTGTNGITSVGGNLTASSNNTAITQGSSALTVGNATS
jgi:filamentous hemagglutinin family protein